MQNNKIRILIEVLVFVILLLFIIESYSLDTEVTGRFYHEFSYESHHEEVCGFLDKVDSVEESGSEINRLKI